LLIILHIHQPNKQKAKLRKQKAKLRKQKAKLRKPQTVRQQHSAMERNKKCPFKNLEHTKITAAV